MKLDELRIKKDEDSEETRFVRNALEQKLRLNDEAYKIILQLLKDTTDEKAIVTMVNSMEHCINLISNNHAVFFELVSTVTRINFNGNIEIAKALLQFSVSLASINSNFNHLIFTMLFRELMYLAPFEHPTEEDHVIEEPIRLQLIDMIHNTIQSIIKVSPLCDGDCLRCCKMYYPYITKETHLHKHAVSNILRMLSYAPVLRERALSMIIERVIQIDVEIRIEDGDDEMADYNPGDSLSEKLDAILLILFQYIEQEVGKSPENAKTLFRILQKIFEKCIMLTHRSKYTQFLLFYICHFDPMFVERFVGRLVDWYCSEEAPVVTRQICAVYCASFICRANYVNIDIIRSVLYFSLTWINKYIDMYDVQENPLNPGDPGHLVFYSLMQSVCYILCFTSKRFEQEVNGLSFLRKWDWTRIVNSPLDPLRYCIISIAVEFIRVCRRYDLLRLPEINSDFAAYLISSQIKQENDQYERDKTDIGSGYNPLDSFFPFDPFLLRESSKYISPLYVNWSDIMEDDENYDDSDYEDYEEYGSSLSMSLESHGSSQCAFSSSLSAQLEEEAMKTRVRERKLSVSMFYEEGSAETLDAPTNEKNPLSHEQNDDDEDDDDDFQKLSFTKQRKMSDASGW